MALRHRGLARGLRFLATRNDLIASLQPELAAFKVFPLLNSYLEKVVITLIEQHCCLFQ